MNIQTSNEVIRELENELSRLKALARDFIELTEKAIGLCDKVIIRFRKMVLQDGFKNEDEEIYFFKHIKPRVKSKFIFYTEVFNIEAHRPKVENKGQVEYLKDVIKRICIYLNENKEFYQYYKRDRTEFDTIYFIRGNSDIRIHEDSIYAHTDPEFSTGYDYTLARIMAYKQLKNYIGNEIQKLKRNQNGNSGENNEFVSNLYWTHNNVDAVELVYALFFAKVINHGKASRIEIARAFEKMFNLDLKNFYGTFKEIQGRADQTSFLKHLIATLQKYLDDLEE